MPSSIFVAWRLFEVGVKVAGAMKDANDVEMTARAILIPVPNENDVVTEDDAAIARAQFRPWSANHGRQCRKVLAVSGYALDERIRCSANLTFLFNVSRDFGNVPSRRGPVLQARHSVLRRLPELIEVLVRITAHVIGREISTLSVSG